MSSILGIVQHLLCHWQALGMLPLVEAPALDMASLVVAFASAALARTSDDALVGDNSNNVVPVALLAFAA